MSRQSIPAEPHAGVAESKPRLLGRLGLGADASDQDVESAHNGVVEFLELAPREVKSWAAAQITDVDEAFALLSGLEATQATATQAAVMALDAPGDLQEHTPTSPPAPSEVAAFASKKSRRKQMVWAAGPLLAVAVVLGVFQMGKSDVPGISGTPTNQTSATAAPGPTTAPVDPAKVAALMTKISANPKDITSLQGLGNLYFAAQDYKNAALWEQKVLGVDPKNKIALISIGAAQFNSGNQSDAKKNWLVAAGLYPKEAEVHYDLGFLYFSQTPPDKAKMTAEWEKVVAIDPNSALAKTVATHLTSATSAPTGSATPRTK